MFGIPAAYSSTHWLLISNWHLCHKIWSSIMIYACPPRGRYHATYIQTYPKLTWRCAFCLPTAPCIISHIIGRPPHEHHQPAPQPSSSSSFSFGFMSIFFATTGFGFAAGFFAAVVDLDRPLGSGFVPGFFCERSASQAAKSGSPSSKGVADASGADFWALADGPSKKPSSSPMSPHESPPSSALSSGKNSWATAEGLGDAPRDDSGGGEVTAWRWRFDADAVGALFASGPGDAVRAGVLAPDPFAAVCMSPAAEDSLFVNDEIAHPVQPEDSLACGVAIRGAAVPAA